MAAIIKANSSLSAGNLVVLKQSITTTDDGSMNYAVDYCCLSQFAIKWAPFFRTRAQPPTPLPAAMLQLNLTKTPELFNLNTETQNGLTYYKATYSAGVSTEVIITEESDTRNFTVSTNQQVGFWVTTPGTIGGGSNSFVQTGERTVTTTIDYISVTVTAESKNTNLPAIRGRVEGVGGDYKIKLVERTSKRRDSRGEFTFSKSSSGTIESFTQSGGQITLTAIAAGG
jgi:hypothetical protein